MAENLSLVAQLIIDRTKALVAIQEQHAELTVYEWDHDSGDFVLNSDREKIVVARLCLGCTPESIKEQIDDAEYDAAGNYDDVHFPCKTRKLADEALTARMARTNQGDDNE